MSTFGAEMAQRAAAYDALWQQRNIDGVAVPRFVESVKKEIRDYVELVETIKDGEHPPEWKVKIYDFVNLNAKERIIARRLLEKEGLKVTPITHLLLKKMTTFGAEMAQRVARYKELYTKKRKEFDAHAVPMFVEQVKTEVRAYMTRMEENMDPSSNPSWNIIISKFPGLTREQREMAKDALEKEGLEVGVSPYTPSGSAYWIVQWH